MQLEFDFRFPWEQWVDTSSFMSSIADLGDGPSAKVAGDLQKSQGRPRESISLFVKECCKEGLGVTIPFPALLQPSQLMPFSSILVCTPFLHPCVPFLLFVC